MATQILVIFLIRTAAPAWTSRPHRLLVLTSLGALAAAVALALSPVGEVFGFTALSWALVGTIAVLVAVYLAMAEYLKRFAVGVAERHRHRRARYRARHIEDRSSAQHMTKRAKGL